MAMSLSLPCAPGVQEAILAAAKGEVEEAAGITPADAAEKKRKKKAKRQAAETEAAAGEPFDQPKSLAIYGLMPLACESRGYGLTCKVLSLQVGGVGCYCSESQQNE